MKRIVHHALFWPAVTLALLLEFQWPHAILLGVIGCGVALFLIWPPVQARVDALRPAPQALAFLRSQIFLM